MLVSFAAVFRLVTQRSSPGEERCMASLKTAAKETIWMQSCKNVRSTNHVDGQTKLQVIIIKKMEWTFKKY